MAFPFLKNSLKNGFSDPVIHMVHTTFVWILFLAKLHAARNNSL